MKPSKPSYKSIIVNLANYGALPVGLILESLWQSCELSNFPQQNVVISRTDPGLDPFCSPSGNQAWLAGNPHSK